MAIRVLMSHNGGVGDCVRRFANYALRQRSRGPD